jgi:hypothetical protein
MQECVGREEAKTKEYPKMPQLESINLNGIPPEAPYQATQVEKWFARVSLALVGILYCLSLFYRWPRLAFLCSFPTAVPFCYFFIRDAQNLTEPWMRKVIVEVVAIHSLVLFGIIELWRTFPIIATLYWPSSVATVIVIGESIVIAVLLHLQRLKKEN